MHCYYPYVFLVSQNALCAAAKHPGKLAEMAASTTKDFHIKVDVLALIFIYLDVQAMETTSSKKFGENL